MLGQADTTHVSDESKLTIRLEGIVTRALAKQEDDLVVQRRIAAATKASHASIAGVNITDTDTVGCRAL